MKEREVKIIIHGDVVIMQMGEMEKAAFMAALLERVLELRHKRKEVDGHAT